MKKNLFPFILVTSLFFMWGLASNMTDTLLAAFKRIMGMTDFQTSWIQIAFYGSYFFLALPAAWLIKKYEYKTGILVGLGMYIIGALGFYPASLSMEYSHFLVSLFILAGGLAVLETTSNPYILSMGEENSATQRLNLAQSFNPIGAITGVALSKFFILSQLSQSSQEERAMMDLGTLQILKNKELTAVMGPYVAVACLLCGLWLVIFFTKMPKAIKEQIPTDVIASIRRLLNNRNYKLGVLAQFFYLGAQIGTWSFIIRYVSSEAQVSEDEASNYYLASLVLFIISRFITTWLMSYVKPEKLFYYVVILACLLTTAVISTYGMVSIYALVGVSGCLSLMFPTIFSFAVKDLGGDTKIGGAGVIMSIAGGAFFPPIQGAISDYTGSISFSFVVPLFCFLFLMWYSYRVVLPSIKDG